MKKRKVLELNACGLHLVGYFEEGKTNPWRVYELYTAPGRYGYPTKHRRMVCEYANFFSVSCHIHELVKGSPEAWQD